MTTTRKSASDPDREVEEVRNGASLGALWMDGTRKSAVVETGNGALLYEEIGRLKVELYWLKKVGMLD
jgi:hypothetical protein